MALGEKRVCNGLPRCFGESLYVKVRRARHFTLLRLTYEYLNYTSTKCESILCGLCNNWPLPNKQILKERGENN